MRSVAIAMVLVVSSGALADEGRVQDYVSGARAAALGGAFGAIADDATGVFYNPAGLADVRTARVNVATSLYGLEIIGGTAVDNAIVHGKVSATDLILVPSSTGYVQGLGDTLPSGAYSDAFAFSTMVPEYTSRFLSVIDDDRARSISALTDRRLLAGAGWGHRAGPWLRWGLAAHYSLRTIDAEESLAADNIAGTNGGFIHASTSLRASNHGLRLAGGAKLWLGPRAAIGITVTSPSVSLWRDVAFEQIVASSTGPPPPDPSTDYADFTELRASGRQFEFQQDLPGSLRIGFAFTEPGAFTVSADVIGYLPTKYDVLGVGVLKDSDRIAIEGANVPIPLIVDRNAIANVSLGYEQNVSENFSIAVAGFSDLTSAPELVIVDGKIAPGTSQLSHVHMGGVTVSLGFHGEFGVTRVGFTATSGGGEIVQRGALTEGFLRDGPALVPTVQTQTLLYVFWSSTFRFGDEASDRDYSL